MPLSISPSRADRKSRVKIAVTTYSYFLIAAGVVTLMLFGATSYFRNRDGAWHQASGIRGVDEMQRWRRGRWEYRKMSEQERRDKQENEVW